MQGPAEENHMDRLERLNINTSGINNLAKSVACSVTGAAGSAIEYIRRRGLRRIGRDLNRCVTRNPVQSMVALTTVGFLAGLAARRR